MALPMAAFQIRIALRAFLRRKLADRENREEENSVLGRPGSDLLFQVLRLSTIGAGEINGRVRDGIGF